MKILAFGASYSKKSINKALASYVASKFEGHEVEVLDLNQFNLPVFTVDLEEEIGHPVIINDFLKKIENSDLLIISMAEHNGAYTSAFKNLMDWTSRVKGIFFEGKNMLLLSTSPGARGGKSSLAIARDRFPRHGANILDTFSLPEFEKNFDRNSGITNSDLNTTLEEIIRKTQTDLKID